MTITALRLDLDGTTKRVDLRGNGTRTTLTGLREEIGCRTVDCLTLGAENNNRVDMWIDDEGALGAEPEDLNYVANTILSTLDVKINGYIFGHVVFAESNDDGDTISITDEVAAGLEELAGKISGGTLFKLWKQELKDSEQ